MKTEYVPKYIHRKMALTYYVVWYVLDHMYFVNTFGFRHCTDMEQSLIPDPRCVSLQVLSTRYYLVSTRNK